MTRETMSSFLSARIVRVCLVCCLLLGLAGCRLSEWNSPYRQTEASKNILYSSFSERPKHLDPAVAYSENEYVFIAQIYEPPYQYHYLKRPYQLIPLTAESLPEVKYIDAAGRELDSGQTEQVAESLYNIRIKPGIRFQPHPAFARSEDGRYLYHRLSAEEITEIHSLADFPEHGTRELTAEDYVYQIKRLADPKTQSPIAEIMKHYIVGFAELAEWLKQHPEQDIRGVSLSGVELVDRYQYRIRIKGKYPQFRFWLAMPFFAPVPWEATAFYGQSGLPEKNITLDWYPVGTGPYYLSENNPNRRMILQKNPWFHDEYFPRQGETQDSAKGLLADAGKKLPFIEQAVFMLEKETIPYWNKFLQGYYDASGIASDSFDQAVQFASGGEAQLTPMMREKGVQLQTAVTTSIFYMGINMLDSVVGGDSEAARLLRRALAIAVDYEEYIAIFTNGRGVAAQGLIPPGIYGYLDGEVGINPYVYEWHDGQARRKSVDVARRLMVQAGYPNGIDPKTGEALILYFDTTSVSVDDRPRMNWFRKQFAKLGIKLVVRPTDYNRFQEKMRNGDGQLFLWGWNADYPDPENFFFLLYGPNGKVNNGGENAVNYANPEFDRLFEQMRNMENGEQRLRIIQQMQEILRRDAPWLFGFHPKSFALYHSWYKNLKPNLMANNRMKYMRIDAVQREQKRQAWNRPELWPLGLLVLVLAVVLIPALRAYRRRLSERL